MINKKIILIFFIFFSFVLTKDTIANFKQDNFQKNEINLPDDVVSVDLVFSEEEYNYLLSNEYNLSDEELNEKAKILILKNYSNRKMNRNNYKYIELTPDEKKLLVSNTYAASKVYKAKVIAENKTIEFFYGYGSLEDNDADAFRHAYFNVLMVKYLSEYRGKTNLIVGINVAKKFADAHEINDVHGQKVISKEMDLYNNQVGRNIVRDSYYANGKFLSDEKLAILVKENIDSGKMKRIDNKTLVPTGKVLIKDGWVKENNLWYYKEKGKNAIYWRNINGHWFYFNNNGVMQTGWQKIKGKWYYMNSGGYMQTGWQIINGKKYYLDFKNGDMKEGWLKLGNDWYYFKPGDGAMQTGWIKIDSKWYYLYKDGKMATGWISVSGKRYYLLSNGSMVTGYQYIGNILYEFDSSGVLVMKNSIVHNYYDPKKPHISLRNTKV